MRSGGHHLHGQFVVSADGVILELGFACLGGTYTLPSNVYFEAAGRVPTFSEPLCDPVRLDGAYYLLGNVHGHFGHGILEGLSRLWAIAESPTEYRDCRLLVFEPTLPKYAQFALEALGISPDRVVHCPPNAVMERLVVPTRSYRTHHWALPAQAGVWSRIGRFADPAKPTSRSNSSIKLPDRC